MATAESTIRVSEFVNEPFVDFSTAENKRAMEAALKKVAVGVRAGISDVHRREDGDYDREDDVDESVAPQTSDRSVSDGYGGTCEAGGGSGERRRLKRGSGCRRRSGWKLCFARRRYLRERKFEISALICAEVGKSWIEADADTAETIDFLEFYGREMLRLAGQHPVTPMKGEKNYLVYIPLGVGVVIPPWNFPAAIAAGMTAASLVTGNTVVLKPSEESPTTAAKMVEILYEAGIPKEALNFLTGAGRDCGRCAGEESEDEIYRVHGIEGSGVADQRSGGEESAGADVDQARGAGDGRKRRDDCG